MRVVLISDLHANRDALEALSDVLAGADRVLCLGDLVGYYAQVNETLDYLRELEPICVLGNHDRFLLQGCPDDAPEAVRFGIDLADRLIDEDHRRWLATLPWCWGGELAGVSYLLSHGSPWRPFSDYLYEDRLESRRLAEFDYDVIAFGQTHRPLLHTTARPRLVNPGSVGQSRHSAARACAVIVDSEPLELLPIERSYDPSRVIAAARRLGAGAWIEKHLV